MKHRLFVEAAQRRYADARLSVRAIAARLMVNATRPTAFIHVGTVKTGTTYLQKTFWQNAAIFEQFGIGYPFVFPPALHLPRYANAEFTFNRTRDNEAFDQFRNARTEKLLISEEGTFFFMPRLNHPALRWLERTAIVYVRRPAELISSWAAEAAQPYNAMLSKLTTGYGPMDIEQAIGILSQSYEASIRRFMHFVDANTHIRVIARPYEMASWKNNDLLTDFLDCMGVSADEVRKHPDFRDPGATNEGTSRKFCDISCMTWEILGKPTAVEHYAYPLVRGIYDECESGDERPVIETVSDLVIEEISDRFAFFETFLSDRYYGGEPFFRNRMPAIYGRQREPHKPVDRHEVESLALAAAQRSA